MTRTQLADDLAAYLRPLVDKNCSTNIRDRPTQMVVEIELVHPKHGVRVLAYSYEHLDDSSPEALNQEIDYLGLCPALDQEDCQPLLITNEGPKSYTR